MRAFEYASPTTVEQAVTLLGKNFRKAEVLAGGTDLLSLMKDDVAQPKMLVNIKELGPMRGISASPTKGLRIGALTTLQELADNPQARRGYPALSEAAGEIAGPQIRNMGTVGGNLCQRPRCWYYRAGFGLLALDEKGESLVPGGDNRYHAILGNGGPAYFVSPSSLAPVLVAMGAKVTLAGPQGTREVEVEKFFIIPKSADEREHDLRPNEIMTEITVPPLAGARSVFYEVRQKEAMDWPLAVASVVVQMSGNTVKAARVVMGHVAPVPWRSTEAEQSLIGKPLNEETAQAAAAAAVSGAKALSRNGYKIQLARVAVKRALLEAAGGGKR